MHSKLKYNRLLILHILFWALYFSFFFYQITYPRRGVDPDYLKAFIDAVVQVLVMAGISYANYFYFLPSFLEDKKVGKYLFQFLVPLVLISIAHIWFKRFLILDLNDAKWTGYFFSMRFVSQHIISTVFIVAFISMLRFAKDWFELEAKRREIENEKLISELRFLKEQINPHFLFNTLNNLYYLAHTKSPKTKDVIEKLSQMMRYMIYEANNDKVPVAQEIDYIKNYVDLEKLRLEEDIPITLNIEGEYEHLQINPLIFITFLENAFKHGVGQGDGNSWVSVEIKFKEEICEYTVSNSLFESTNPDKIEGIGLSNTKRRLDLSYNNSHDLSISQSDQRFDAKLKIDLSL